MKVSKTTKQLFFRKITFPNLLFAHFQKCKYIQNVKCFKNIVQNFKKLKYQKSNCFWKVKNSKRNITKNIIKWLPAKLLHSGENIIFIIFWCLYSPEMQLEHVKNIFHVAHFHINMVLSARNMFKEVKLIKSRGALRTGFTYAPVLLFELLPSGKL